MDKADLRHKSRLLWNHVKNKREQVMSIPVYGCRFLDDKLAIEVFEDDALLHMCPGTNKPASALTWFAFFSRCSKKKLVIKDARLKDVVLKMTTQYNFAKEVDAKDFLHVSLEGNIVKVLEVFKTILNVFLLASTPTCTYGEFREMFYFASEDFTFAIKPDRVMKLYTDRMCNMDLSRT